ncbi:hypothetical protein FEK35_27470 [Nocardia cyriacigeorgica]|uniref:NUMOD4 domain-containing protein n=1 Tax=Nocardia cyriacigeorgica TaxID=135487 RepID=A0A5R8P746_9NOCA|nr:NUMOD4 domain-containing protein [Nocardia cyriacigeorgica]TLF96832.1 hypothetical protein FEK35_27470 [Nocardia cyriacigeorgica]
MDDTNEQWKPIPGYERTYEASTAGRIRSLDRLIPSVPTPYLHRGRILKPVPEHNGRLKVALSQDGKRRMVDVSRLVGEAFLGIPPDGYCIAHVSADRSDNRVVNLQTIPREDSRRRPRGPRKPRRR